MNSAIIVYGATGAVGSHTVKLLHDQNYNLHLIARDKDKLEKLGSDLNVGVTLGDINDSSLFKRVKDDTGNEIGGIVYAVGTINLGSIRRLKESDFLNDFKVNAMGGRIGRPVYITQT